MLEKTMRLNFLFDFYQSLLTPKQREYMHMYYLEDFSLVEIANISKVSRQAIYDNIKRTEGILESYEEHLNLYKKYKQRKALFTKLEETSKETENKSELLVLIEQLKQLG